MYYTLIIISIILYMYFIKIDQIEDKKFYKYYLPIFLILFFTFALQYDVGTDYSSYLQAATKNDLGQFKLNQFINDHEYFFAIIVAISQLFSWSQSIFFIVSFIQNVFFAIILKEIKKNNLSVSTFMFFYFFLSLCFFNQFNGIRQFIAILIIILAFIKLYTNKKLVSLILFISSTLFHKSSIIMIIFIALFYFLINKEPIKKLMSKKYYFFLCIFLFFIYFIDLNFIILSISKILGFYAEYSTSSYVTKMSFTEIITKLIKLLIVFYSIYRLKTSKLNFFEKILFYMGCLSSMVMILSFSSTIIWRIYLFFDLFIIFPVLLFFKYEASLFEKKCIILYLSVFLFVKILIIPKGEYLYHSILFK